MANTHETLTSLFTDIADAIREKIGDTGDTLTWDGNTEGLTCVGDYYKISDAVVTENDLASGAFVTAPNLELTENLSIYPMDIGCITGAINEIVIYVFITQDAVGVDFEGLIFPEVGVYFRSFGDDETSLTINGYTGFVSKIVADNFPDAIGEIETCPEDALFLKEKIKTLSSPSGASLSDFIYGNNMFVSVGYRQAAYSEDCVTWNEVELPSGTKYGLTFGNGVFINMIGKSSTVLYSTDCITWSNSTLPFSEDIYVCCYGNGKFICIAKNTFNAAYSEDGITWTPITLPVSSYWNSIIYANGKYIAVGNHIIYSEDGITWTEGEAPLTTLYDIVYNDGVFVASSNNSNYCYYSIDDALTWHPVSIPQIGLSEQRWSRGAYGSGKFVFANMRLEEAGIPSKSNIINYSFDGMTWIQSTLPVSDNWYSVIYNNNRFIIGGYDYILTSHDGINWFDYITETNIVNINDTDVTEETVQATGILDSELATQDDLIAQIAVALEGKTGASGGAEIETCTVTISDANSYFQYIIATVFENNIISRYCSTDNSGTSLNNVIKGTSVIIVSNNDIVQESSGCTIQELMITGMIAKQACFEAYITGNTIITLSSSGDSGEDPS